MPSTRKSKRPFSSLAGAGPRLARQVRCTPPLSFRHPRHCVWWSGFPAATHRPSLAIGGRVLPCAKRHWATECGNPTQIGALPRGNRSRCLSLCWPKARSAGYGERNPARSRARPASFFPLHFAPLRSAAKPTLQADLPRDLLHSLDRARRRCRILLIGCASVELSVRRVHDRANRGPRRDTSGRCGGLEWTQRYFGVSVEPLRRQPRNSPSDQSQESGVASPRNQFEPKTPVNSMSCWGFLFGAKSLPQ